MLNCFFILGSLSQVLLSLINSRNQGVTHLFLRLYTINKWFHHCSTVYSKGTAGMERMLSPVRDVLLRGNYSQTTQDEDDACISESYVFHTLCWQELLSKFIAIWSTTEGGKPLFRRLENLFRKICGTSLQKDSGFLNSVPLLPGGKQEC